MTARYPRPTHSSIRALIERLRAPGYGWCFNCGRPWKFVSGHQTPYKPEHGEHGCFPLCETCWAQLTPDERLPYYDLMVSMWIAQIPANADAYERDRELIRAAVLNGR